MKEIFNSKLKGLIQGRRIYREKRGLWHIQDIKNPSKAMFSGTLREIERGLKGNLVKIS